MMKFCSNTAIFQKVFQKHFVIQNLHPVHLDCRLYNLAVSFYTTIWFFLAQKSKVNPKKLFKSDFLPPVAFWDTNNDAFRRMLPNFCWPEIPKNRLTTQNCLKTVFFLKNKLVFRRTVFFFVFWQVDCSCDNSDDIYLRKTLQFSQAKPL